ncbi:MAG: PQQ-like beta-propeller repeat protein [Thaumarchaeota archaeon]|nr:PQQ-like beta-propeller repeat protein [Nitrososphaerota archaeon]
MSSRTPSSARRWSTVLASAAVVLILTLSTSVMSSTAPTPVAPIWLATQGGAHSDVGWGVTSDDAGALYYVGSTTVPGPLADIFVTKVNPSNGKTIWNVTYNGGGDDSAYQVVWNAGKVYVGGRSFNSTDRTLNMLVQAYNASDGGLIWTTTWESSPGAGYHEVDGIVVDGAVLYAAGWAAVPGHSQDIGVLKVDTTDGHLIWSRTWGTSGWDEANGDIVMDSSRIYVAGRYNSPNVFYGGRAVVVSFEKSDGSYVKNVTWWEGSGEADFLGMTGDSNFLYPVGISATTGDRIVLQQYDRNLTLVWTALWESSSSESSRMDRVTQGGNGIVVSGQTSCYGNGNSDALLLGYDLGGNLLWSTIWGGAEADGPQGLELLGGYAYVSGQTTSFGAGSQDAFLAKFALSQTSTSTTPSQTFATTTASTNSPSTSASSSTSTSTAGGIPEFPFQFGSTLLATVVILGSYLLARRVAQPWSGK